MTIGRREFLRKLAIMGGGALTMSPVPVSTPEQVKPAIVQVPQEPETAVLSESEPVEVAVVADDRTKYLSLYWDHLPSTCCFAVKQDIWPGGKGS